MNGIIEGYVGTEGSGKSLVMTYFGTKMVKAGMKVYAFPGYELKDKLGNTISEVIKPEDWVDLPDWLNNVAILIDEIQNWFPIENFSSVMVRLFKFMAAQRRKRNLVILYTVQNWGWIPPAIRQLTHTLVFCRDMYFGHQYDAEPIPRGQTIMTRRMDVKGFYTGKEGWLGRTQFLNHADRIWPFYNSFAVVDLMESFVKVNIKRREIDVGDVPTPIDGSEGDFLRNNLKELPHYNLGNKQGLVNQFVTEIRMGEDKLLPVKVIQERLRSLGIHEGRNKLGEYLKNCGVKWQRHNEFGSVYNFG